MYSVSALWKGSGAIVAGVGPARAIHFFSYAQCKRLLKANGVDGTAMHVTAAALAAVCSLTCAWEFPFVRSVLVTAGVCV